MKTIQKPHVWEISRLCRETLTKLYVHEFGFRLIGPAGIWVGSSSKFTLCLKFWSPAPPSKPAPLPPPPTTGCANVPYYWGQEGWSRVVNTVVKCPRLHIQVTFTRRGFLGRALYFVPYFLFIYTAYPEDCNAFFYFWSPWPRPGPRTFSQLTVTSVTIMFHYATVEFGCKTKWI